MTQENLCHSRLGECCLHFILDRADPCIFKGMKKIHTPNHNLYEEYYLNQAKQKGGNLPALQGARFQRGYGLGSIFRGLFRWAVPHLKQGAKMLGKKALQTGVNVAQDVLAGENLKTAVKRQGKKALGLTSQNSPQPGAGKKGTKGKRSEEITVRLQARNGKHLHSRRNSKRDL